MSACGHENIVEKRFEVEAGTLRLRKCRRCGMVGARLNDSDSIWSRFEDAQTDAKREALMLCLIHALPVVLGALLGLGIALWLRWS